MVQEVDIVVSGGSIEGICDTAGFLKALVKDRGYTIRSAAATSAGAVILGTYASGRSIEEIEQIILDLDFTTWVPIPKAHNILKIIRGAYRGWISDGEELLRFMEVLTSHKKFSESTVDLHIAGTDFDGGRLHDFCHTNNPDMLMAEAMRITAAIPGCYKLPEYEGTRWCDGSLRSHYPVELVPVSSRPFYGFLASYVDMKDQPMRAMSLYEKVIRLIDHHLDVNIQYSHNIAQRQPLTIKHVGPGNNKWTISREERAQLIENARKATLEQIEQAEKAPLFSPPQKAVIKVKPRSKRQPTQKPKKQKYERRRKGAKYAGGYQ